MKQMSRILGVFLFVLVLCSLVLPFSALAATADEINTDHAAEGWFTVEHNADLGVKMKVCVVFKGEKTYYNYTPGSVGTFSFTKGPGDYTVSLYRNVGGSSYRKIATKTVSVKEIDPLAQYKVSTTEITFSETDSVGMKAAELCSELKAADAKVVAIYNYIASDFEYDYDFAAKVNAGGGTNYVPDTNAILEAKKGVCYDISALFAAMCRSQGVAARIDRGYHNGQYHAWNSVYVGGAWVSIDVTSDVCHTVFEAVESIDDVVIPAAEYVKQA